jgi:hypothetical protein
MISILVQNIMTATDWRRLIFECKRDQSHLVLLDFGESLLTDSIPPYIIRSLLTFRVVS